MDKTKERIVKRLLGEKTKIVINRCYGGFSISIEALYQLVKIKSSVVDKMALKKYFGDDWEEGIKGEMIVDYKDGFRRHTSYSTLFDDEYAYSLESDDNVRGHPDLVKVVMKLGKMANGNCAELHIVEIPNDVKWQIEEYDGMEHIAEKHRTW